MRDYRCPNCGGSFSLPLGMDCPDHHPEPVEPEPASPPDTVA